MEKFGQREEENLSEDQSLAGNSHITTFVNPNNISSEETKNEFNLFDPVKQDNTEEGSSRFPPKNTTKIKKISDPEYNAYYDAPFWPNEDIPFYFIASCLEEVSAIKGENIKKRIIDVLSNMFRSILLLTPDQLYLACYFCLSKVAPDYEDINDFGVEDKILIRAIEASSGQNINFVTEQKKLNDDLAEIAALSRNIKPTFISFFLKSKDNSSSLTLKELSGNLLKIAYSQGKNSIKEKELILTKVLLDTKDIEAKYIIRFLQRNIKVGITQMTVQAALIRAFVIKAYINEVDPNVKIDNCADLIPNFAQIVEEFENAVNNSLAVLPDLKKLIDGMIKVGKDIHKLQEICKITPGIPLKPMLPTPIKDLNENSKLTFEFKYDGIRCHIHYHDGICQIFDRTLKNISARYPDIINSVLNSKAIDIKNFIIDAEIVPVNTTTRRILPFVSLITKKSEPIGNNINDTGVCIFVFDLLCLNDNSLLMEPLFERRKCLESNFKEIECRFKFAENINTNKFSEIKEFLNYSIKEGCEGLIMKNLEINSCYAPSKRSLQWLKLKKDYLSKIFKDSFDLVPIGATYGKGKKEGQYGAYLMATYNPDMERYETFCKLGVGFCDESSAKLFEFFQGHLLQEPLNQYFTEVEGIDVWFEPCTVWEVIGADIQISPLHKTAIDQIESNKGLCLRFPRFIRVRNDKTPIEATYSSTIASVYQYNTTNAGYQEN